MIVFKAEYWPKGDNKRSQNLGTIVISDEGPNFPVVENLQISQCRCGDDIKLKTGKKLRLMLRDKHKWHTGNLLEFPPDVKGPWALLSYALNIIQVEDQKEKTNESDYLD